MPPGLTEYLIAALTTLVVVVDPIGLAPIFAGLTQGLPAAMKRGIAFRASAIAVGILAASALVGQWLLTKLGISLPAFRIAGGLFLFAIAFEMVYGKRTDRQSNTAQNAAETDTAEKDRAAHIAAFPLGIPLLAGPGAIAATLLLAGRAAGDPSYLAGLIGVIVLVGLIAATSFCVAAAITRLLGVVGNLVLTRLLGVILAALAVQFVIDGVRAAAGM
ncbi:MAG: MarC family protein [Rhizobiales bacterium]|nr:MarC family protein [Hyphomicrobiales bacterium]